VSQLKTTILTSYILQMPLSVLDLFCGCGGMTQGLIQAGLNVVAGIDVWDKAISSYSANFPAHQAICADLRELPPEEFQARHNSANVKFDLIVGGPPCQGFSIAGKRAPDDPRSSLFMEYVKYLNFYQPKAFIMENVIGILSAKTPSGEKAIDVILEQFQQNYNCIVCKLYASDFEVPQNRRRVIIIGIRKDLGIQPTEPMPLYTEAKRPAVGTVLLPREEVEASYYLSQKAIDGMNNRRASARSKGHGFGAQILDPAKPSYTISARYYKDGSDALVKYSETEIRRLTPLELRRIQGFPDDYILLGNKKEVCMQIGNAVAGRFAYHLGKHIEQLLV